MGAPFPHSLFPLIRKLKIVQALAQRGENNPPVKKKMKKLTRQVFFPPASCLLPSCTRDNFNNLLCLLGLKTLSPQTGTEV